jgi:HEAT repeat protein
MARPVLSILAVLMVLRLASSGAATMADRTPIQLKVTNILSKYPARSAAEMDGLAAELLSLGREGVLEVCRRLAGPGKDANASPRYAIDGLSLRFSRPGGAEKERLLYVGALFAALDKAPDADARAFIISQVQIVGKGEAVKPLARYIKDPRLGEPAARALLTIRTPEAEKALLMSLGPSSGMTRTAIVKALGGLRSRAAVERILPLADSRDDVLREATLQALAEIGDARAERELSTFPIVSSAGERAKAASRYLLFARRQAEAGQKDACVRICRNLIDKLAARQENQVRSEALSLLFETLGKDAVDELLQAMDSPDRQYRAHALELAASVPGQEATEKWLGRISTVSLEARADIIAMLGARGDKTALPLILENLKNGEKSVRLAAIPASFKLGGREALPNLMPLLSAGDDEETGLVKQALLGAAGEVAVTLAAGAFTDAPPLARKALIEVLAARQARAHADLIWEAVKNGNEIVRPAALAALENVVRGDDLPRTIDLLLAATSPAEVSSLQNALTAAAGLIPDPERRADLILAALEKEKGARRADLIRPLARIGGAKALQAVAAEANSSDPQVRTGAVYALSQWPDMGASEALLDIVRTAADRKYGYLAVQGYVRLVNASGMPADQRLDLLKGALETAKEANERNLVVAALSGIRTRESFRTAVFLLSDPVLRAKAAESAARIAMPMPGDKGLAGIETARCLKKASAFLEDDWFREQVERRTTDILVQEGFVSLFNNEDLLGWRGLVEDPVKRAKMGPAELRAGQQKADDDMRLHWKVLDGVLVFDGKGQSLCTTRDYGDFELFVDWKIEPGGDSGIYLRGSPQVQIRDPAKGPEGSGGLYNNQIGPPKPLVPADNPVGSWNTFHILMTGDRVTVFLNDVLVVEDVIMENYWERGKPIYPTGQIELQAHSTPLDFKDIYLREIK